MRWIHFPVAFNWLLLYLVKSESDTLRPPDTDEPEGLKLIRFTILGLIFRCSAHHNDGMCVVSALQTPALQDAEIAFHVSLIQVVIAGRPEQPYSWCDN